MADPISIFKTITGFIGSLFSFASKYFVQPKIECSWQRIDRTNSDMPYVKDGIYTLDMDYQYELRFTNNSEYPAYHMKLISCDLEVLNKNIDYNLPIPPHQSKTYYINARYQYRHTEKGKMPVIPQSVRFKELRFEYANGKGKRFYTIYKPDEPIENRNQFGRV